MNLNINAPIEIPDSPNGIYRLGGSMGGSVKISGSDKIIGKFIKQDF